MRVLLDLIVCAIVFVICVGYVVGKFTYKFATHKDGEPKKVRPEHSAMVLSIFALVMGLTFNWPAWLCIVLTIFVLAFGASTLQETLNRVMEARHEKIKAMRARADAQNAAYLQGESWGTYGVTSPPQPSPDA